MEVTPWELKQMHRRQGLADLIRNAGSLKFSSEEMCTLAKEFLPRVGGVLSWGCALLHFAKRHYQARRCLQAAV